MKRVFDIVAGFAILILAAPVMIVIGFIVGLQMGTPVIFKQIRAGMHGKTFILYKYRTMTNCKGRKGDLLPDGQRITKIGKFLRDTSLDELPEIINILKGEMTFVGPRPLLVRYLDRYTIEQARRHEVMPGLTGWAQINGRNGISWEERLELDVWYVDNQSLWLDLKIIALTICKVIRQDGINPADRATMPEFIGTNKESF
jgi:sugar transferase EpsL